MMNFAPLAYHLEQTTALKGRLTKIRAIAEHLRPHIQCTCSFYEQGEHLGCPAYMLEQLIERTLSKKELKQRKRHR